MSAAVEGINGFKRTFEIPIQLWARDRCGILVWRVLLTDPAAKGGREFLNTKPCLAGWTAAVKDLPANRSSQPLSCGLNAKNAALSRPMMPAGASFE